MKIIDLQQGTKEWLEWRKTKITASEIPIILGVSKWCTPFVLWKRKLGFEEEQEENFAMKKGNILEPIARDLANLELECQFIPMVVEHDEIKWAAASLDGLDKKKKAILEIKCPGKEDHEKAFNGEVPKHYIPQIQWQLFCSNLKICYYVSYYNESITIVKVKRDDEYIASILPKAGEFKKHIEDMVPPSRSENDFIHIADDKFEYYANKWKEASDLLKEYKSIEEDCKKKMIEFTDDSNCEGYGVRLQRIRKEGGIDYKKAFENVLNEFPEVAQKIQLDSYRKKEIGYWLVSKLKRDYTIYTQ